MFRRLIKVRAPSCVFNATCSGCFSLATASTPVLPIRFYCHSGRTSNEDSSAPAEVGMDAETLFASIRQIIPESITSPLEVPSLSSKLSDAALEALESHGGLAGFLKSKPQDFSLGRNPKGILTVSRVKQLDAATQKQLFTVFEPLVPRNQFVAVASIYVQLNSEQKALMKVHFKSLTGYFAATSIHFRLSDSQLEVIQLDGKGNLFPGVTIAPPAGAPSSKLPSAPAAPAAFGSFVSPGGAPPLVNTHLEALQPYMPSNFFVPVLELSKRLPAHIRNKFPNGLYSTLEAMTSMEVDVRVLGDAPEDVFVRLVGEELPFTPIEQGEKLFNDFSIGQELIQKLQETVLHEQAPRRWIRIDEFPDIVGGEEEYERLFPLRGPPSILVFDRLQHLFDVNIEQYAVQRKEKFHTALMRDFTFRSTPTPRALRNIYFCLVEESTPDHVQRILTDGTIHDIGMCFNGSLEEFVASHRLYLYHKDGKIWTTRLAGLKLANAKLTDREVAARELYDALPHRGCTTYKSLQNAVTRETYIAVGENPRGFFEDHPSLFAVYDLMFENKWVVQRQELPIPNTAHKPVRDVNDVLFQLAVASVDGVMETSVLNHCSKEARNMLRRLGGVDTFVKNFPNWFLFIPSASGVRGQGFMKYIGHLSVEEKEKMKRKGRM